MAAQFADLFIKLSDYVGWAVSEGCRIQTGFVASGSGAISFTVITAPDGKYVVVHGVDPEEQLPYSVYKAYDRRLGLTYMPRLFS